MYTELAPSDEVLYQLNVYRICVGALWVPATRREDDIQLFIERYQSALVSGCCCAKSARFRVERALCKYKYTPQGLSILLDSSIA